MKRFVSTRTRSCIIACKHTLAEQSLYQAALIQMCAHPKAIAVEGNVSIAMLSRNIQLYCKPTQLTSLCQVEQVSLPHTMPEYLVCMRLATSAVARTKHLIYNKHNRIIDCKMLDPGKATKSGFVAHHEASTITVQWSPDEGVICRSSLSKIL